MGDRWLQIGLFVSGFCAAMPLVHSLHRSRAMWKAKANHWLAQSNEHEADADYYRSLLGWTHKHGKPVAAPPHAYPSDLVMGTRATPVMSPLGHPAYASTLEDLLAECRPGDRGEGEEA